MMAILLILSAALGAALRSGSVLDDGPGAPGVRVLDREFDGRILLRVPRIGWHAVDLRGRPAEKLPAGEFLPLFEVTPVDSTPLLKGWFTRARFRPMYSGVDPGIAPSDGKTLYQSLLSLEEGMRGGRPLRDFEYLPTRWAMRWGHCVVVEIRWKAKLGLRSIVRYLVIRQPDGMIILRSRHDAAERIGGTPAPAWIIERLRLGI